MDLVERQENADQRHPWESVRADFIIDVLRDNGLLSAGSRWLDVGAGDAWFASQLLAQLRPDATVTCWDVNYTPDDVSDGRATDRLELVAERPDGPYDQVLMLDVIEHVEDDERFVSDIVENLMCRSGSLLVTVPAYQQLYSRHDEAHRHFRRYAPEQCRTLLRDAGLCIRREGGLFHSLLGIRYALALVERRRPPARQPQGIGAWQGGTLTTRVIEGALGAESRASLMLGSRGVFVPGLSYWALCELEAA